MDEMKDFMVFHKYNDSVALALVGAASAVLGVYVVLFSTTSIRAQYVKVNSRTIEQ